MRHNSDSPSPDGGDDGDVEHTATVGETRFRAAAPTPIEVGALIAERYQLEASIGQGGSGTVFRAWDRTLGEPVAIKLLHPERAREQSWIKRLVREVKVARAIRHPNVCRVFDLGNADGHWFVTMELAVGGALQQLLRDSGAVASERPLSERLADARALCNGLAAIHAVGIIHRDVTPQNVLRMHGGRLVVSDFGLAIESTDNTTFHGGTPAYMPPEALLGGRSDQRSDVWQLGTILHEILFGKKPEWDRGATGLAMKWPLPSDASPVEEELARLCGDCLAHDPAQRPASAVVVAGRLAAAELARPRSFAVRTWMRAQAFLRAHRWLPATVVALIVAAGVARGTQILTRRPLCRGAEERLEGVWDPRTKAAVGKAFADTGKTYAMDTFWSVNRLVEDYAQRWTGMYTQACEATHVRGEQSAEVLDLRMSCLQDRLGSLKALTQLFSQPDGAMVENAAAAASQLPGIDRCGDVKLLRSLIPPPEDPAARARVDELRRRLAKTRALFYSGSVKDADKLSVELVADVRRQDHAPVLAEALELRGRILGELGSKDSEPAMEEAVWTAEAARHDELKAEAAIGLIYITGSLGAQFAIAEKWGRLSEATLNRIGGHQRQHVWLEKHMGNLLEAQGRNEEALSRYKQALVIAEQALPPDDPDVMRVENDFVTVLTAMGRPAEALGHNDRAIAIGRRVFGAQHPVVAPYYSNRAEVLNGLSRWREARDAASGAMAIWERQLPQDHLFFSYSLTAVGQSYLGEGRPAAALAPLERALGIRRAKDVPLRVGETAFALARAIWDSGQDRERARSLAREARDAYATLPNMKNEQDKVSRWLKDHP